MVMPLAAYLAFLGLLAAERITELIISARHARWAFAQGAREAGRRHYPVMAAFHTLFIASCAAEAVFLERAFPGLMGWIALAGALSAQALRYWAVATLGHRWNTRILVIPGTAPITAGPYRFVRHPNYVAIVIEMVCVPMIYGDWITALVFSAGNVWMLRVRILAEETALGESYQKTFAAVPRLIPRLRNQ